jgi:hypothetical protein
MPKPLHHLASSHGPDIELRIIEQRKVNLPAHRGNVGLVEEELGGTSPALAELGLLMRERQHVIGSLADRAQDAAVLGRKGQCSTPPGPRMLSRRRATTRFSSPSFSRFSAGCAEARPPRCAGAHAGVRDSSQDRLRALEAQQGGDHTRPLQPCSARGAGGGGHQGRHVDIGCVTSSAKEQPVAIRQQNGFLRHVTESPRH